MSDSTEPLSGQLPRVFALMTLWGHRVSGQFRLGLLTLAPILIVAVLLALLPPDGNERAEWAQFIGRFHPLAVHFPIALILLVPILELAGLSSRFSYLRSSAGFVLGLATLSATAAAILGWCLGRSGGYSGPLVTQHMWGGISLAAVCWLCWILRARSSERRIGTCLRSCACGRGWSCGLDRLPRRAIVSRRRSSHRAHARRLRHAAWTLEWRSIIGRTPDQTLFMVRGLSPSSRHAASPATAQANIKQTCGSTVTGGVMRGGKNGPVIRAGNVQGSDLFRRITLPPGHDDFMPKEGKRPLSADQVKLIELWIGAGASGTLPVNAIKGAPAGFRVPDGCRSDLRGD